MSRSGNETDERADQPVVQVTAEPPAPMAKVDVLRRAATGLAVSIVVLLTLGALGTELVFDDTIGDLESDLVAWVADHRVGAIDSVATVVSTVTDTWTVIGVMVGAVSMLWVTGHARAALTVALGMAIELIAFLAVGEVIDRARPDVDPLHSVPTTSSFPSGHTAAAVVLYGTLVLAMRTVTGRSMSRLLWLVPSAVAITVAAARVYEGVHYPSDVIAGMVLGLLVLVSTGRSTEVLTLRRALDAPFRAVERRSGGQVAAIGPDGRDASAGVNERRRTSPPIRFGGARSGNDPINRGMEH